MRLSTSSIILSLVLFCSCQRTPSPTSIDVDRLADTYAELLALNERYNLTNDTTAVLAYKTEYQEILSKHGLTQEEYAKQFTAAAEYPGIYRQLCDRALTRLQTMRTKQELNKPRG